MAQSPKLSTRSINDDVWERPMRVARNRRGLFPFFWKERKMSTVNKNNPIWKRRKRPQLKPHRETNHTWERNRK